MQHLARLENFANESVAHFQSAADGRWRADNQVKRKSGVDPLTDAGGLLGTNATVGHDHEQVDVRVGPRLASGVRPKKNDTLRMKLVYECSDKGPDFFRFNHR